MEFSLSMGRGVSCGGGESSLGYLFGSGESPQSAAKPTPTPTPTPIPTPLEKSSEPTSADVAKQTPASIKQTPAGIKSDPSNNYFRAEGQNRGNFITDRPSTKVHAAPGGGSSLGYLFGSGGGGPN